MIKWTILEHVLEEDMEQTDKREKQLDDAEEHLIALDVQR